MVITTFLLLLLNIFLHLSPALCGRTTNKYTSLPGGGFHHHGGFLGGYFSFFRGSRDNPADSFSDKYDGQDEDMLNDKTYVDAENVKDFVDEDYKIAFL